MNYTYIVECSDGSYYTGWTTNLKNRVDTHNSGKGAKYTRSRRPVKLIYYEEYSTKSEAMKREYAIKQLSRKDKEKIIMMKVIKKKLFISQPMNGLTDQEIIETREAIMKEYPEYEEIKSFLDINTSQVAVPALYYLGRSLQLMAEADAVYFASGWESARGCRIEHDCAVAYGMTILGD